MKALLDEQISAPIAVPLRQAGCDVVAVADREDLAGSSDRILLEAASREARAVVTNNIKDFRPLAAEWLAQGRTHAGLILLPSSRAPHPRRRLRARRRDRAGASRPPGRTERE